MRFFSSGLFFREISQGVNRAYQSENTVAQKEVCNRKGFMPLAPSDSGLLFCSSSAYGP